MGESENLMKKTVITSVSATINARGNVDFFCADRTMSTDVSTFMFCVVRRKEVEETYKKKIEEYKTSISNYDNLVGSVFEKDIPALKDTAYAEIAKLEAERDKILDEEATFKATNSDKDKAFKKALNKGLATDELAEEVAKWFDNYGIDVRNTYFLDEVLETFGSKVSIQTLVRTDGKKAMKLDSANALKNMYGVAYEHMVSVGTIKATAIPELLRDKYAPKKSGKKEKKSKKSETK